MKIPLAVRYSSYAWWFARIIVGFSDAIKSLFQLAVILTIEVNFYIQFSVAIILRILAATDIYIDTGKECLYIPDEETAIYLHFVTFYFNNVILNSSPVAYRHVSGVHVTTLELYHNFTKFEYTP
jgi:hypothetical protein